MHATIPYALGGALSLNRDVPGDFGAGDSDDEGHQRQHGHQREHQGQGSETGGKKKVAQCGHRQPCGGGEKGEGCRETEQRQQPGELQTVVREHDASPPNWSRPRGKPGDSLRADTPSTGIRDVDAYLQVIFLGVLQGIAEFLPISSSGHLVLAKYLLEKSGVHIAFPLDDITLDVGLHLGTLGSIVVIYFRDLLAALRQPKLLLALVIGSIPAGIAGVCFGDQIESLFTSRALVGFGLLITAALLLIAQSLERGRYTTTDMPLLLAGVVGLFQGVAVLPGISRSGSTICGGMIGGLHRDAAARFSFFLAVIAIGGAGLLKAKDAIEAGKLPLDPLVLLVGILTSFLVGCLSLKFLLRVISKNKLHWFSLYCAIVGVAAIVWSVVQP